MVVLVKNKYIEMTPEEIAAIQAKVAEQLAAEMPALEPSPEERIAALEQDNAELLEAMDALLLGVTA